MRIPRLRSLSLERTWLTIVHYDRPAPICHDRAEDNCRERGGTRVTLSTNPTVDGVKEAKRAFARLPPIPRNLLLLQPFTFIHYSRPRVTTQRRVCLLFSLFLRFVLACPRENTNTLCKRCEKFAPLSSSVRFLEREKESDRARGVDAIRV